jgi:hypothetical protein
MAKGISATRSREVMVTVNDLQAVIIVTLPVNFVVCIDGAALHATALKKSWKLGNSRYDDV